MPRVIYIHRDTALSMIGCLPPRRAGETDKQYEARKGSAARHAERKYKLAPYSVEGKRARRYREDEVFALAERIVKPAA